MSAPSNHYGNSAVTGASKPPAFLKHVNTGSLALALFVAFAFLTSSRGQWPAPGGSAHATEVARPCDNVRTAHQELKGRNPLPNGGRKSCNA